MARQMTLMEEVIFSKIKRTEYLKGNWNEKRYAPNLFDLIGLINVHPIRMKFIN